MFIAPCSMRAEQDTPSLEINEAHVRLDAQPATAIPDGTVLSYRPEPDIAFPNYDGPMAIRDLKVAGDVQRLTFRRNSGSGQPESLETWERVHVETVGAHVVSVFERLFTADEVSQFFRGTVVGPEQPFVSFGWVEHEDSSRRTYFGGYVASPSLPESSVTVIDDIVQFASTTLSERTIWMRSRE